VVLAARPIRFVPAFLCTPRRFVKTFFSLPFLPSILNCPPATGLESANPTLYQQSLTGLDATQQAVLADVAAKANEGGDAVVAEKAWAAMQAEEEAEA
jgi:hypothetical protein